ncbi:MAG: sulfatase-like hydrolase/transferase [Bryobacteraceae bacterium]|nr:sulfatase-like hydrolase/transferase [Bryobacteraceae bacterium]
MALTRRSFLTTAAVPVAAQRRAGDGRPNIVLILADDLGAWMLGCYGNKEIRTPHIDVLAGTGVRFLNHYVCTPICSPSRATLFTGRVPRQHGIHDFLTAKPIEHPPQGQAEPPASFRDEIMLSDLLAAAGYDCGYVGKWHMGDDAKPQHGYHFWHTLLGGSSPYQNPRLSRNGEIVQEHGYLAEILTQRAVEFLENRRKEAPFFLVVSHFNPHVPYEGHPQKYYDMYADVRFETIGWQPPAKNALREKEYLDDIVGNIRKCAAAVTALDDQVGALMNALQRMGLRENTLVIFTADNGFLLGRHGLWSKGHASDPINMYEEVVKTPMIWSWWGKIPAQATRPELVSAYDFLPSVCEAVGIAPPADRNLCGRSYLALATNRPLPKNQPWRNLVFGHFRNTEMVRDARFKLVLRNEGEGPNELYDLRGDPQERVNQYANDGFLTVRERLAQELAAWRRRYS